MQTDIFHERRHKIPYYDLTILTRQRQKKLAKKLSDKLSIVKTE